MKMYTGLWRIKTVSALSPHYLSGMDHTFFDRRPRIMGILNVTPDSFSDGGKFLLPETAVARAEAMVQQGATIIDIGGESTRPGSDPVDEATELERTVPVLELLAKHLPGIVLSIDTTKFAVAQQALKAGAKIVNDVSGLRKEPRLASLCAEYNATLVIMHSIGDPKTMQQDPQYDDVVAEVEDFLKEKTAIAKKEGVKSILWDYGIGFGKTLDHNLALLRATGRFASSGYPLLVGASRKAVIGALLGGRPAAGRAAGSAAAHLWAAVHGAAVLRVHDVQETADSLAIWKAVECG
jgi:dihydropteroate synthase